MTPKACSLYDEIKLKKLKGIKVSVSSIISDDRKYLKELIDNLYVEVDVGSQGRYVGFIKILDT